MQKELYVIGHPIGHSLSPAVHNAIYSHFGIDAIYYSVDTRDIAQTLAELKEGGFYGANVTMPYKNAVIPLVDAVTPLVVGTRSVNTLYWNGSDLCGTSTDPIGFTDGLAAHGVSLDAVKRVAIVGNGGVARVVMSVFRGKPITLVCRNKSNGEMLAQEIDPETIQAVSLEDFIASDTSAYDLIVNTSPVGMFPNVDASPLPKEALHPNQVVYDLIYNPTTTKLLCLAKNAGCKTVAGYEMFLHQAIESDKIWFPQLCDVDPAELYKVAELGFHRCD